MKGFRWPIRGLAAAAIVTAVVGCAAPTPWNAVQGPVAPIISTGSLPHKPSSGQAHPSNQAESFQIRGQNAGYPTTNAAAFNPGPNGYPRNPMSVSGQPFSQQPYPTPSPVTTYQTPTGPAFGQNSAVNNVQPFAAPQGNVMPAPAGASDVLPAPNGPAFVGPPPVGGELGLPPNFADIDAFVEEARTGRFMFGVGVNSSAGVTGQIVLDERNFDITRVPTSWDDFVNGTAFRGAGQAFRLEALPGNQVQRYMFSFTEPYFLDTPVSLSLSGFFYNRAFFDWDEERYGGRVALGYRLTHDLSISAAVRAEEVKISDPRVPNEPELNAVLGDNELYAGQVTLTHDTRDIPFAPTEGHFIELGFQQVFGTFDYPRADIDVRKYHLILERPDGSGRHTLSYGVRLGFAGTQTPVYDHYFAGGFSTLRGYDFRGASPVGAGGVIVGGEFRMLGSVEYLFPLTADDMIRGVVFCDVGTVEDDVRFNDDTFRVAPGFGLRVNVPAMGPAPLAFDFAFPVNSAATDDEEVFSFFIGFGRL